MADMSVETKTQGFAGKETALALGGILRDHKGDNSLVIDLREMNAWTDFFVIATASSNTHLDGLERHVREFCAGENIEVLRRSRRPSTSDDEWRLLDLGAVVVHLMSANARSFYELERLYPPPHAKIISEQKQSE